MGAFKVGDEVEWESQSAGRWSLKIGVVDEVVPPGGSPSRKLSKNPVPGMPRREESYVVRVKGRGSYWPRASSLKPRAPTESKP